MYDKNKKVLAFPHLIPGDTLGGRQHVFNNINGGMKRLADFNLIRNKFFGGNVEVFGKVKEYGFYLCPHYETKRILGFYIYDPSTVTERGKELIQQRYPDTKIIWDKLAPIDKPISAEDMEKRKGLIEKAKEKGAKDAEINNATLDELDGLLQAMESGKGARVVQEMAGIDDSDKNREVNIQHNSKPRTKVRK